MHRFKLQEEFKKYSRPQLNWKLTRGLPGHDIQSCYICCICIITFTISVLHNVGPANHYTNPIRLKGNVRTLFIARVNKFAMDKNSRCKLHCEQFTRMRSFVISVEFLEESSGSQLRLFTPSWLRAWYHF